MWQFSVLPTTPEETPTLKEFQRFYQNKKKKEVFLNLFHLMHT